MDAVQTLLNHRSIRKFSPEPVSDEQLDLMLQAAIRGSNTGNMQLYSFVVTRDKNRKEELCQWHFGQRSVADAAAVITVCVDVERFHQWCHLNGAERSYDNFLWFYTGSIDACIASQNLCIAAEANGLGICYFGTVTYRAKEISAFLQLPKGVIPVTTIAVGYPAEEPKQTFRLPTEAVVHQEHYRNGSNEEIARWYAPLENSEEMKAIVKENNVPNLANVFTQKRYTKATAKAISQSFLAFLEEQEFMNND